MHLFYVVGDGVLDRLLNEKERERVIGNYVIRLRGNLRNLICMVL
jgi:hypothetical protein